MNVGRSFANGQSMLRRLETQRRSQPVGRRSPYSVSKEAAQAFKSLQKQDAQKRERIQNLPSERRYTASRKMSAVAAYTGNNILTTIRNMTSKSTIFQRNARRSQHNQPAAPTKNGR